MEFRKILFLVCSILFVCNLHANTGHNLMEKLSHSTMHQQDENHKTDVFIDNDSNECVWISVGSQSFFLFPGETLNLYSDEIELKEIAIKMSKTPASGVFFNQKVPNHSRIKVSDYLHI